MLERELSSERSRLRSMASEQGRMQREKNQIVTDMQRTERVSYIERKHHSQPEYFRRT